MSRTDTLASDNTESTKPKTCASPEASKEIPVLAYSSKSSSPPEYAMIEVNGNLIPPIEFPPEETCVQVFGKDRTVELGKLFRSGPDKASGISSRENRTRQMNASVYKRLQSPYERTISVYLYISVYIYIIYIHISKRGRDVHYIH